MPDTDLFLRLAAALAIGLLVGMERGWKTRGAEDHRRSAGIRTFGLSGLMGGVSGVLGQEFGAILIGAAFLGFAAALGTFAVLESKVTGDVSATTLIAGLATFLLGALAVAGDISVAIAMAVSMTVLLALRSQLHSWLFNLTWPEIRAALVLLVMSFLLLPLLPDRTLDPWGAVNLREVWIFAIVMAGISFAGYVAIKVFGGTWGIIVTAAAGGVASSTATTLAIARMGQGNAGAANLLSAGILISGMVMMVRVWALAVALNPALFDRLYGLFAGLVVLAVAAVALLAMNRQTDPEKQATAVTIRNPLELWTALRLAALIVLITLAVEAARAYWGDAGVLYLAALSGTVDVDAITISMARMDSATDLAATAILLAAAVNTVSKAALAGWLGGKAIGLRVSLTSIAATGTIWAAYVMAG